MASEKILVAVARVNTDGTVDFSRNCTVARAGAGLYDVTLGQALDKDECQVVVESETTDQTNFVTHTSDTVKRISIRSLAPAAADGAFCVSFYQVAFGGQ